MSVTWEIRQGDALEQLRELADESVQCVVTSPPYWGLRDYGTEAVIWDAPDECDHDWGPLERGKRQDIKPVDQTTSTARLGVDERQSAAAINSGRFCRRCSAWLGHLGLEPSPEMFVAHLVEVLREVRRVLRADGTLWLNLGDSYASKARGSDAGWDKSRLTNPGTVQKAQAASLRSTGERHRGKASGLKEKDLIGIPWLTALALRADGWWLRSDIIWSKPNPMPESVLDRPTSAHEHVFLLARSPRYFYDGDAIRESATYAGPNGAQHSPYGQGFTRRSGNKERKLADGADGQRPADHRGHGVPWEGFSRNKRNVWEITTQPFPQAHFATFPPKLVEPCILAGTPEGGGVHRA